MSTLSDDTLRKILVQIQQTAVQSQRAHSLSVQQTSSKERERRILQLTVNEIAALRSDVKFYKGVGKMFLGIPRGELDVEHRKQEEELTNDIASLNKKSKYLEKQFHDAQSQLRDIFHHVPK